MTFAVRTIERAPTLHTSRTRCGYLAVVRRSDATLAVASPGLQRILPERAGPQQANVIAPARRHDIH